MKVVSVEEGLVSACMSDVTLLPHSVALFNVQAEIHILPSSSPSPASSSLSPLYIGSNLHFSCGYEVENIHVDRAHTNIDSNNNDDDNDSNTTILSSSQPHQHQCRMTIVFKAFMASRAQSGAVWVRLPKKVSLGLLLCAAECTLLYTQTNKQSYAHPHTRCTHTQKASLSPPTACFKQTTPPTTAPPPTTPTPPACACECVDEEAGVWKVCVCFGVRSSLTLEIVW